MSAPWSKEEKPDTFSFYVKEKVDDDTWDPFEGHADKEADGGRTVTLMEDDDELEETTGMAQALPGNSSDIARSGVRPLRPMSVDPVAKVNADIREVENTLHELQNKKDVIESQLSSAKQVGNKDAEDLLQKPIKQVKEQILTKKNHLKKLKEERSKVENEVKVKNAWMNYTKNKENKDMFIHTLFKKVKNGRLDDVKVMTKALDMEGVNIADLKDDKTRYPLLHKALLEDKQDIVSFLLKHKKATEMGMQVVKTDYCEELTPLYIAIQQGKAENVKQLLQALTPEDINKKVKNTDYESTFFNELPLAAALWSSTGRDDLTDLSAMFDCLVQKGAKLDLQTEDDENTLLHLLVAQASQSVKHLDYFRRFLEQTFTEAAGIWYNSKYQSLSQKDAQVKGIKKLLAIENKNGHTPLTLAAQLESPLYADLINWKDVMRYPDPKRGQQFSNFDAYDVTNVSSLKGSPEKGLHYNRNSVMHVLAHNNVDITQAVWDEDISTLEPLKSIINLKWQLYEHIFYCWGFLHLVYMGVFTGIIFHFGPKNVLPAKTNATEINLSNASLAMVGMVLESGYYGQVKEGNPWFILFVTLPLAYIIFEIIDHCSVGKSKVKYECSFTSLCYRLKGWISSLLHLTGNGIYRLIGLLFSIFTLIWIMLHMMRNINQDIVLSVALLLGWLFSIMFTRTINFPNQSSQIGAFSIMVQRMLFNDLFPFFIISVFILVGFSSAIHATLLHSEETTTEGTEFKDTFFGMLKYYSALNNGQDHKSSREKEFAKAVLSVFGIISVILLINMLIAAMNKTYEMVQATHRDLVVRQRLAILLMLERRLPFQCLRVKSESKLKTHKQKRLLGVVSMKEPVPIARNTLKSHGNNS